MISALRAALLCNAVYQGDEGFAFFDPGADDGVCWALRREPDADVVVLRGSLEPRDWIVDLFAAPFPDHRFGPVHHGFLLGMDHAWSDVKKVLSGLPVVLAGHSLGAARAAILNAIMLAEGVRPAMRFAFGEPRPGFQTLAGLLTQTPCAIYCNGDDDGHDLVTEVPFTMPPTFDYRPSGTVQSVCGGWSGLRDDLFRYHHAPLYVKAFTRGG